MEYWKFQDNGVQLILLCNIKWDYLPLLLLFCFVNTPHFSSPFSPQKTIFPLEVGGGRELGLGLAKC